MTFLRRNIGRVLGISLIATVAMAALVPSAFAFTAPTLSSPSAGATTTEGKNISFTWSGSLQGDASAISQSYFRVDIASTGDVPAGVNAEWTSLANWGMTTPGASTPTSMSMAAPDAPQSGTYSWRVCAWGVEDASSNDTNDITILACSAARVLSVTGVTDSSESSQIVQENTKTISGQDSTQVVYKDTPKSSSGTTYEYRTRSAGPSEFDEKALAESADSSSTSSNLTSSPLADSGLDDSTLGSALGGIGNVVDGLNWKVPGVPIPFWTLLLPMMILPFSYLWKRSAFRMFDIPLADELGNVSENVENGVKPQANSAEVASTDAAS